MKHESIFSPMTCVAALSALACTGAYSEATFKRFEGSIIPLPPAAVVKNVAGLAEDLRPLPLTFSLRMNNKAELEKRVGTGPVSSKEMSARYGGDPVAANKLMDWLKSNGFKDIRSDVEGTRISATATAAQIEKSLDARMTTIRYRDVDYTTATTAPRLPSDIGDAVIYVGGLQPWIQATKHSIARDPEVAAASSGASHIAPRPAAVKAKTYKVADILNAYGGSHLGVTGRGQVIGILIDTGPEPSDLELFWKGNGLPVDQNRVQVIPVKGPTAKLPPVTGEESLDAEWASGIARDATIKVYAAGSVEYVDLDRALQTIYDDAKKPDGPRQLSISLGLREDLVSADERTSEAEIFLRLAALGVTVFVSSGDAGSNPDQWGNPGSNVAAPEYEASDIWVVGVGGTSLTLDQTAGARVNESAWSGSGGGYSAAARPSWQSSKGFSNTAVRGVPDVSCVADPTPGAYVIRKGQEWPVGGTSWSAPVWAGFAALLAEQRQKQGKPARGFLGPLLYKLDRQASFNDITAGSNGKYQARAGWNEVTGLGTPKLSQLFATLP